MAITDRLVSSPPPWAAIKSTVGSLSLDVVVIKQNAAVYEPGMVLGRIAATGKYVPFAPAATDGSETAAAVMPVGVDATGGDQQAGVITRLAEVWGHRLVWPDGVTGPEKAAAADDLAQTNIIIRSEG